MPFLTDFSLLNIAALSSLAILMIPILIHLFNPSRGKLILIGQIELISQIKDARVFDIRVSQWLLLLIRLLLFLFLVLLMSGLTKNSLHQNIEETRIFLTVDWLNNATQKEKEKLEQHDVEHYYLLSANFPFQSLEEIERQAKNISRQAKKISVDTLIAEAQAKNLLARKNILYTTNRADQFLIHDRPLDIASRFEWRVKVLSNLPVNNLTNNSAVNIAVFYSESRLLDYQYLKAALDTLSTYSEVSINVQYYSIQTDPTQAFGNSSLDNQYHDWIIWLSEKPVTDEINQQVILGSYLLTDKHGSASISNSHRHSENKILIDNFWVSFYSSLTKNQSDEWKALWYNQQGRTALYVRNIGQGKQFQFASRFHPEWTDLVEDIRFPLLLSRLFSKIPSLTKSQYLSKSELSQAISLDQSEIERVVSYRSLLIFMICLLWLLERLLSERRSIVHD